MIALPKEVTKNTTITRLTAKGLLDNKKAHLLFVTSGGFGGHSGKAQTLLLFYEQHSRCSSSLVFMYDRYLICKVFILLPGPGERVPA